MITYILIAAVIVMLASLSGKLVTWGALGRWAGRNLRYLTSFALGVFVVTLALMVRETQELDVSLGWALLLAAAGALVLEGVQRLIPDAHHHHGAEEGDCCAEDDHEHRHRINPRRVLLGDAAHNMGDGILLASAFLIDLHVGVAAAVGIVLHEMVQEVSEFFILQEAGYSTSRALWSNFAVSSTILVGSLLAFMVASAESLVPYLIAFSAGATLYIIVMDLLPHMFATARKHGELIRHVIVAALGGLVLFGVVSAVPHEHEHGGEVHTDEHQRV